MQAVNAESWHLKLGPSASRRLPESAAARDWPQLGCCPPADAAGDQLWGAAAGQGHCWVLQSLMEHRTRLTARSFAARNVPAVQQVQGAQRMKRSLTWVRSSTSFQVCQAALRSADTGFCVMVCSRVFCSLWYSSLEGETAPCSSGSSRLRCDGRQAELQQQQQQPPM